MQKPHPAAGEQRAGGFFVVAFYRLDAGVQFVVLDGGADDIDLVPGSDLLFQKAVHIPPLAPGDEPGPDGLAAGGQLVQHRDVQVAVEQQPQRAGDGRGAHDQQMGAFGLAGQDAPLPHAEAVLLVHDGKAQVFELYLVGQHRMGAHHQPGAAVRNGGKRHTALGGFHAAHQQRDVDAERLQPVGQGGGVLAGQQLGGGQHGALPAVLRRMPDGRRRHQRFAAAHIALQKAVHGHLAAKVAADLPGGAALGVCGRIGQTAPEGRKVHRVHRRAGLLPAVPPQQEDAQLQNIQFLKNQAAAGGGRVLGAFGGVDGADGRRAGGHAVFGQQKSRQRVGQVIGSVQRGGGRTGDAPAGQPLGAGIDRHQRGGGHVGLGADGGVQNFPPGQAAAHAALEIIALADLQVLGHIGGVEPGERQRAGIVGGQHPGQHPAALDTAGRFLLQNLGPDAAVHVVGGLGHGVGPGIVHIAARIVEQQIPHGMDAQFGKLFGKRRADAFQVLDVVIQFWHGGTSFRCKSGHIGSIPGTFDLSAPARELRVRRLQAASAPAPGAAVQKGRTRLHAAGGHGAKFVLFCTVNRRLTRRRSYNSRPAGRR